MQRIVPVFLCLAAVLSVHADVVELDNGQKIEGNILGFSNQRFDVADKSGSISHFSLQRVKRIEFESSTANDCCSRARDVTRTATGAAGRLLHPAQ